MKPPCPHSNFRAPGEGRLVRAVAGCQRTDWRGRCPLAVGEIPTSNGRPVGEQHHLIEGSHVQGGRGVGLPADLGCGAPQRAGAHAATCATCGPAGGPQEPMCKRSTPSESCDRWPPTVALPPQSTWCDHRCWKEDTGRRRARSTAGALRPATVLYDPATCDLLASWAARATSNKARIHTTAASVSAVGTLRVAMQLAEAFHHMLQCLPR